jgi:hypothetical protein
MLIDTRSTFAWEEDFFGAAATAKVGEAMDLTAHPTDMGEGYPLYLVIQITTAMVGGTSVAFNLVTADNAALSSGAVTLLSSAVIAQASATAGTVVLVVPLPKADYKRYLGLTATRVGTSTEGAVSAFLVQDPPNWRPYPEGNN